MNAEQLESKLNQAGEALNAIIEAGNDIDAMFRLLAAVADALDDPLPASVSPELAQALDAVKAFVDAHPFSQ